MLIRFEKCSLYFLQQLGESNFVLFASLGKLEKTIWKWFLFLYNKHIWCLQANTEIKAKLKPLFFYGLYQAVFFYTCVSAFFLRFSTVTENIKRCSGWCSGWAVPGKVDGYQGAGGEGTHMHTDMLTLRSLASNSHDSWRWTEHTKRVE